jgi:hypothetical protein
MARDTFEDQSEDALAARAASGDALGSALVIVTTIVLAIAFYLVEKGLKDHYNGGMFQDKTAAPPPA